ncbi:MAG: hypothetical protein QE487_06450 [Fluviicola sp.]|nr:hypothetical protein [Fluviicola sp.]
MATITVNYIAYNRAGNRLHVPLHESVIDTVNETCSTNDDYTVSIHPIMEHEGKELHFAFLAASGTSEGSLLSFNAGTQNIPVGDTHIRVTVVYLIHSEVPTVFTDVFNLETSAFTNSDFIDTVSENGSVAEKTTALNEHGLISTETEKKVKAHEMVDSVSFSIWKPFPAESASGNREYIIEQAQRGYLFAFYGGKNKT